ncbi:MAG: hypothetical protein CVV23_02295 [Ignavibacteriae bacterium HGW-Ignavibacteriae-2]|jgi:predicted NBD/HSP70 family sugar kinase|nr:MAG: hypothetical protein CVV23_02295 [Ignavibacteriae bacterium HGW-Ignavibacteriae-2]
MYKSGSTRLIRNLNKNHVLNLVRLSNSVTAREISNLTGLQMSTVLYTLKSLEQDGFIKNLGFGNTTSLGGKPPVLWGIQNSYGNVIGIELFSTEIRLVVLNFSRECLYKNIFPHKRIKNPEELVIKIKNIINTLLSKQILNKGKILGIGIGMPGSIDNKNGKILFSYPFGFHKIPLKKMLENEIPFLFEIDNDANAGALGVKWLQPQFQDKKHILYVSIHQKFSGMGIGYIFNDRIYRGARNAAGELKLFITDAVWLKILKTITKKEPNDKLVIELNQNKDHHNLKSVLKYAEQGSKTGTYILGEIAKEISKHLAQLVNLLDPEVIVIGGDICEAEMIIKPVLEEQINYYLISEITKNIPFSFSEFREFSGAMGATALIYSKVFGSD